MNVCYYRHRFPNFVISHCAWLYFHFCLSYRDVQELMQAQRFLSAFGIIGNHFRPGRHQIAAPAYRRLMGEQFRVWNEITLVSKAA